MAEGWLARYDGDAVQHAIPGRWSDRDECGLMTYPWMNEIGDTIPVPEPFFTGVAQELVAARARKDNHGVYMTVNRDMTEDDLRAGIRSSLDAADVEDPLYQMAKQTARRTAVTTGAGLGMIYAGWTVHDPLTGFELVAPLTAVAGIGLADSLYNISRCYFGTMTADILAKTEIQEIETIPEGAQTYCIEYRYNEATGPVYHAPLEVNGGPGVPDDLLCTPEWRRVSPTSADE